VDEFPLLPNLLNGFSHGHHSSKVWLIWHPLHDRLSLVILLLVLHLESVMHHLRYILDIDGLCHFLVDFQFEILLQMVHNHGNELNEIYIGLLMSSFFLLGHVLLGSCGCGKHQLVLRIYTLVLRVSLSIFL